ncbi:hypothetical protein [Thiothrix lacustris]|uniref:hypothetical protein n=1 Tax=Thiothrix lacustris TaxID=525917 RepID=UPI0027E3E024|nr:hypothetical protein [Thiothrix lacustris]WMP15735.1 hypothetical protein RCS87_10040 [Thiothrix lacustris]
MSRFTPVSRLAVSRRLSDGQLVSVGVLAQNRQGQEAARIFEGQTDTVLAQLANAGSSGGARPKAQIYLQPDTRQLIARQLDKIYQQNKSLLT